MSMPVYRKGVDFFCSDPNKPVIKNSRCYACGSRMPGTKQEGYHSWVGAMVKHQTVNWVYYCPHVSRRGHGELVELLDEIERLKSEKLKAIVQSEFDEKRRAFRKRLK